MARKTKAELEAEAVARQQAYEAQAEAEYPARLMAALERANSNFTLTVKDSVFVLTDNDNRKAYKLNPTYTNSNSWDLNDFEQLVDEKERAEAEQNRRYLARQSALAKLTKEERELLDLPKY